MFKYLHEHSPSKTGRTAVPPVQFRTSSDFKVAIFQNKMPVHHRYHNTTSKSNCKNWEIARCSSPAYSSAYLIDTAGTAYQRIQLETAEITAIKSAILQYSSKYKLHLHSQSNEHQDVINDCTAQSFYMAHRKMLCGSPHLKINLEIAKRVNPLKQWRIFSYYSEKVSFK